MFRLSLLMRAVLFSLILTGTMLQGEINRIGGVDIGAGFPQLMSVQAQLLALPRWQVGAGYGVLPGSVSFTPRVKELNSFTTTINGVEYKLEPTIKTTLTSLCPFVRFYPTERNFYLQFTYAMLTTKSDVTSGLIDIDDNPVVGAVIKANVELTQLAPTLSIGHLFTSDLFFVNFALGATIFTTVASNKVSITGALPESVAASGAKQEALQRIQSDLGRSVQLAVDKAKKEVIFVPSLLVSFGFLI